MRALNSLLFAKTLTLGLIGVIPLSVAASDTAIVGAESDDCPLSARAPESLLAALFDDLRLLVKYPEPTAEQQARLLRAVLTRKGIQTRPLGDGLTMVLPSGATRLGLLARGVKERFGLRFVINSDLKREAVGALKPHPKDRSIEINERILSDPDELWAVVMVHERVHAANAHQLEAGELTLLSGGIYERVDGITQPRQPLLVLFPSLKTLRHYSDVGFVSLEEPKAYLHSALATLNLASPGVRTANAKWNITAGMKIANAHLEAIAQARKRISSSGATTPRPPQMANSIPQLRSVYFDEWKYIINFELRAGETVHQSYLRRLDIIETYLNTYLKGAGSWIQAQRRHASVATLRKRGVLLMRELNRIEREASGVKK